jgi:phosphoglycolate phosphatase-like HAD superfamily hydrolase
MNKKILIFDFDGVIADSFEEVIKVLNGLSSKFGYKKVEAENISGLRDLSSKDFYLKKFNISRIVLPLVIREAKKILRDRVLKMKPARGISSVLLKLRKEDIVLGVLTTNSVENVEKFLKKYKLDVFEFVYSGNIFFLKDRELKKIIKKHKFNKKDVLYVGDETRDIEAAKKSGVISIAVDWGFNSKKILKEFEPDYLISDPKEFMGILNSRDLS